MAFSHFFGASRLLSAFTIAFQLPNLARRLFGEGALTSSFIPVFTRTREIDGDDAAKKLSGSVFTLLAVILTGLLLIAELSLLIISFFIWGPTLELSAILLPYMLLICVTAFFGGVLNGLNRFAAPAIAPMLLNIVMIVTTWAGASLLHLDDRPHIIMVSCSVLVAGVLQLALQIHWLRTCDFHIKVNFDWRAPAVRRIVMLMAPMMLGLSAIQFNTFLDSMIALWLVADGKGPAILRYSQELSHLPLGIFATALATAIFPLLSKRSAQNDDAGFVEVVETGVRTALFIAIPAGVGLSMVATPLIRVLLEHGSFEAEDTPRVALSLICYNLGLWAYSAQQIIVRAFYSREDSRTPVRIALVMLALNFALNIVLVLTPLRESGVALATAITGSIQTIWLAAKLAQRIEGLRWRRIISTTVRSLVGSGAMAIPIWLLQSHWEGSPVSKWVDATHLTTYVVVGAVVYFLAARALRLEEGAILMRTKSID
jgi:putative peptidoglycan lipid II flippase